jgi:hypothetical protein
MCAEGDIRVAGRLLVLRERITYSASASKGTYITVFVLSLSKPILSKSLSSFASFNLLLASPLAQVVLDAMMVARCLARRMRSPGAVERVAWRRPVA